ncbi:MAG TPA: hypothetical protein VFH80_12705 [Solirubrobacteraceae bacterium]|nr:hypothetical protein [Solirubrobacteraceae bacterium]
MAALLLRTPRAYIVLSGSSAGQALEDYFNQRSLWVLPVTRFCRGVLLLPRDHADYLRGRRRQALRTNLRRAAAAGIRCEIVSDTGRAFDDISDVWRRQWGSLPEAEFELRLNELRKSVARSEVTIAVARDARGRPLAMTAALIDETVCLIKHAVATSHDARWALHDHIVRMLIARQVRYLLADGGGTFGVLGFTHNLQHYQHLLGYELRHVIPVGRRRVTWRRRLIASVVLAAASLAVVVPRAEAHTGAPGAAKHAAAGQTTRAHAHVDIAGPRARMQ